MTLSLHATEHVIGVLKPIPGTALTHSGCGDWKIALEELGAILRGMILWGTLRMVLGFVGGIGGLNGICGVGGKMAGAWSGLSHLDAPAKLRGNGFWREMGRTGRTGDGARQMCLSSRGDSGCFGKWESVRAGAVLSGILNF